MATVICLPSDINQALLRAENPLGLFVMLSRKTTARRTVEAERSSWQIGIETSKNRPRGIAPLEADISLVELKLKGWGNKTTASLATWC